MPIDRRRLLASGAASLATVAFPRAVFQALDGPVLFEKDSLIPDWLNRAGKPAWFGVDVSVSPRSPDEVSAVWITRTFGRGSGYGIEFLAHMTTRELAVERREPLAMYTVAPVRPLQLGECMAYVKGWPSSVSGITSNAVWTGSPHDWWAAASDARYQLNDGTKYEGLREFAWIA
jgi:hypothetical protein